MACKIFGNECPCDATSCHNCNRLEPDGERYKCPVKPRLSGLHNFPFKAARDCFNTTEPAMSVDPNKTPRKPLTEEQKEAKRARDRARNAAKRAAKNGEPPPPKPDKPKKKAAKKAVEPAPAPVEPAPAPVEPAPAPVEPAPAPTPVQKESKFKVKKGFKVKPKSDPESEIESVPPEQVPVITRSVADVVDTSMESRFREYYSDDEIEDSRGRPVSARYIENMFLRSIAECRDFLPANFKGIIPEKVRKNSVTEALVKLFAHVVERELVSRKRPQTDEENENASA